MKKLIIAGALFFILGALYLYKFYFSIELTDTTVKLGEGLVLIAEQKPGNFVIGNFVSLSKNGFLVIQENIDREPYRIIGNSNVLTMGESLNIRVGLKRSTLDGEELFGVLYYDNGDNIFYPGIDIPALDDDGDIIFIKFGISSQASPVNDQD